MGKPLISFAQIAEHDPFFLDVDERPNWQILFGNLNPLKLEIGFGMGNFLIEMAAKEPSSNFIGIDFYHKGIRKIMTRIKNLQLENIRIVYGDIRNKISVLFQDGELNTVYINFPDPWPKIRHHKRRLINTLFLKYISNFLKNSGKLMLATDSKSYIHSIITSIYETQKIFDWENPQYQLWEYKYLNLPRTRFYNKSLKSQRNPMFFILKKI